MADAYEYLSPDFDLNSLTVPRLRSILVSHDVPYPASAKKAQLIRILEEEVLPQAKKLIRERERVRRTSEGITDMGSREASVTSDHGYQRADTDRESVVPPPTPSTVSTAGRRGRSRVSTRGSTADTDDFSVTATPSTSSRRTATRSQGRRQPNPSTEINEDNLTTPLAGIKTPRASTIRKSRRDLTPSTEPEPPTSNIKAEPKEYSVFTDDNPFQSGSSPLASDYKNTRLSTHEGKRKSSTRFSTGKSPYGGVSTWKPETPTYIKKEDDGLLSHRPSFGSPLSQLRSSSKEVGYDEYKDDESSVSVGEEFTPEEQLALEKEQADLLYPPARHNRQPLKQGSMSRVAPWIIIFSLFVSFGIWWRREKIEIGFCGIGKPTWSLAETRVPEWANIIEPQCEPCPSHAFCYPNFEVRCEHDFILTPHPLSLGGLVPLPPTCEPDSEKARRVKAVTDKALEALRDRRAKWECGEAAQDGQELSGPEISETDLKHVVGDRRRKGMSDAEFDDLWKGALGEIISKEEVVTRTNPSSSVLNLTSTSIGRLPLTCAFRRYVRLSLLAYRLPLSVLAICILVGLYVRSRMLARRSDLARVPELVSTTLDRLATQAALHARGEAREPYIPIGQLRDDVLRSELQGRRREELWKRVRSVVEGNANIRAAVREGRGGDVARVWEWVGGIGGVRRESDRKPHPRERGKVHFSGVSNEETRPQDGLSASMVKDGHETFRNWDEGRPVY